VIWSVNGIVGGNSTIGTVDSTGRYVAPVVVPPGGVVTVKAASVVDPAAFATCSVVITKPPTQVPCERQSVVPGQVILGPIGLTVNGSSLYPAHSPVEWRSFSDLIRFQRSIDRNRKCNSNRHRESDSSNPGQSTVSNAVNVKVISGLAVTVFRRRPVYSQRKHNSSSDSGKFTEPGRDLESKQYRGGDPSYGTIDVNGLYTAPLAIPLSGQATVTAVSQVDNTTMEHQR